MNEKIQVARLSVFSNTILIILKAIVGFMSGFVSIISEAIHSFMDLIAAIIAFLAVKFSDNPPDKEHPYSQGKLENVSGVVEVLLITFAAAWIIYEAILKSCINIRSIGFQNLKTRKSGSFGFLKFHLELSETMTLKKIHQICDDIENDIRMKIKNSQINIHVEPIDEKT